MMLPFIMMRTTLNLPDDVYQAARSYARLSEVPLGEALARLVRQAMRPRMEIDSSGVFPCFVVKEPREPITLEHTLAMEDELENEL